MHPTFLKPTAAMLLLASAGWMVCRNEQQASTKSETPSHRWGADVPRKNHSTSGESFAAKLPHAERPERKLFRAPQNRPSLTQRGTTFPPENTITAVPEKSLGHGAAQTVVIEPGPAVDKARTHADELFRTLFGDAAYNLHVMGTMMEVRAPLAPDAAGQ